LRQSSDLEGKSEKKKSREELNAEEIGEGRLTRTEGDVAAGQGKGHANQKQMCFQKKGGLREKEIM